jgi:hypothetical protein
MAQRPTRSLKHEYELFVEQEIDSYKDSLPRSVLLGIGDEAVKVLAAQQQFVLTELLLWEEVDRLIVRRLRLPSYTTWRRRRLKIIEELRRPEHWGLTANDLLVRAVHPSQGNVLLAGADDESSALYLAANGCHVTALTSEADALERVQQAAIGAGLSTRVNALVGTLSSFTPELPLNAVVVSPAALAMLTADERHRVIVALQSATRDGGVHLVRTLIASGTGPDDDEHEGVVSLDELRRRYEGWSVTVERTGSQARAFLARKGAA